jgi:hypothetical protein
MASGGSLKISSRTVYHNSNTDEKMNYQPKIKTRRQKEYKIDFCEMGGFEKIRLVLCVLLINRDRRGKH